MYHASTSYALHDMGYEQEQVGMAGVGARRMMQKQQMQMQRQREAAQREQEQREREWRWKEEEDYQRQQLMIHEQERDHQRRRQQQQEQDAYDEEQRKRRQYEEERVRQSSSSGRYHVVKSETYHQPAVSPPPPPPPLSRKHTDSQITARQEDYSSSDYADQTSVPDGFGGWISTSSVESEASVKLLPCSRRTDLLEHRSPSRSPSPLAVSIGSSPRPAVRETVYEPLPKATCADCGEKLPFDDLVDHTCLRDACRSPLLIRGAESLTNIASSSVAAVEKPAAQTMEPVGSRSTFFDRYEKVRNDYGVSSVGVGAGGSDLNNTFLTPFATPSARSTPSPYMRQAELTPELDRSISANNSPMMRASPLIGLDTDAFGAAESNAEHAASVHALRKKQIEEQRAAARNAAMSRSATPSSSASSPSIERQQLGLGLTTAQSMLPTNASTLTVSSNGNRTHRRGEQSTCSSASTASTKSSTSSFFNRSSPDTLTPSSSNEQVSETSPVSLRGIEKPVRYRPQGSSPSKRILDLHDIEGLVREIENSPSSSNQRLPISKGVTKASRSPAMDQSDGCDGSRYLNVRSINPGSGGGQRTDEAHDKRAPRRDPSSYHDARPTMIRARTKDRVENKLCSVCLKAFEKGQPMVQRDGKILCIDDYAELYLEKCRKCNEAVRTVGVRSRDGALPGLFHRECFSCLECHAAFDDGAFYVFDRAPYCRTHYHRLNRTQCASCQDGIEGQCRQLNETGERFHIHCLTCQFDDGREFCKDLLGDYYVHAGKRLCQWHFEKVMDAKRIAAATATWAGNDRKGGGSDQRSKAVSSSRNEPDLDAVRQAEVRAARRTTYIRTVAAKKARA